MTYTDEQLRRIDAMVERHIMGHDVEWHWCTYDDETVGGWREADSAHTDYRVPANSSGWRFWPCYATDSAPHTKFSVVDNYTTDHNAVAEMRGKLKEMGIAHRFSFRLADILEDAGESIQDHFPWVDASPLQQCLAALAAVGVDVEKELKEIEK